MTIDAHCRVHWRVWVDQPMVRAGPTLLRVVTYGRHENADGRHCAGKHRVEQENVSVALAVVLDVPLVLIVLYILVVPYTDRREHFGNAVQSVRLVRCAAGGYCQHSRIW